MKIELRMSAKNKRGGMKEILLKAKKHIGKETITMRAKSEVLTLPMFFDEEKGIDIGRKRVINADVKQWHLEQKAKLDGIFAAVASAEFNASSEDYSSDWLKRVVELHLHPGTTMKAEMKTFLDLAREYIDGMHGAIGYKRQFMVTVRCVARFEGYMKEVKDKNFVFDPERVTTRDIEGFRDFLANEHKLARKYPRAFKRIATIKVFDADARMGTIGERGCNIIHLRMKQLRTMWRAWNERGLVSNDPFKGWKNEQEHYGTPYYITIEERNIIADAPMPTKHLETQRDIFIFQCLIGCRVSDLSKLTAGNIHDGILEYTPRKTRNEGESAAVARIPLHPKAVELVGKYKGVDKDGRLFPCISDQKYNEAIKEVFAHAGITREVEVRNSLTGEIELRPMNEVASSHMARRTFIGNAYQKVSDPNIIGKMSGHVEGSRAFARYRRIEDDTLRKVIEQL